MQQRQLKPLNIIQAARLIRSQVGNLWTADHYKTLQSTYPSGVVPQESIPDLIVAINTNNHAEMEQSE